MAKIKWSQNQCQCSHLVSSSNDCFFSSPSVDLPGSLSCPVTAGSGVCAASENTGCWQCCHAAVGILAAGSAVTRPVGILGAGSAVTLLLEYWVLAVLLRYCGNSLLCAGSAVTL